MSTTKTPSRSQTTTPARPGLAHTFRSEWIKFQAVSTNRKVCLLAIGLAAILAIIFCISIPVTRGVPIDQLNPTQVVSAALLGIDVAAIVLVVLGAGVVGHEYASGSIEQTFIATPARQRVLISKIGVVALVSAAIGVAAALIGLLIGTAVVASLGHGLGAGITGQTLRLAAGSVLMPVLYSFLSVCGAFLFRGTTGGILVPLALGILAGIFGWFPEAVAGVLIPLTPLAAIHNISGSATPGSTEYMGIPLALVSITLWIIVPFILARQALLRRDA